MGVLCGRGRWGPGRSCDVLEGDCALDFFTSKDNVILPADKDADVAVGGGVWRRHDWGLVWSLSVCWPLFIRWVSSIVYRHSSVVFFLYTSSFSSVRTKLKLLPLVLMDRRPGR